MVLKSELKNLFSDELLKQLASICDTRRIDSSQEKMTLVHQLLKRNNVKFSSVGGATNRLTLFIDTYAVKFALDRQGYRDNLIEYSLSRELQPYVPKTYETNGYCLVVECVKTMTLDDFRIRKTDILRILEILSKDYLLGDVGFITRNFTNWGIRDDGSAVILDYAYVHRATENLFTCEVCGEGILRYDSTFSYLKCSNATVCTAKFEYIDRKNIQGDKVDLDMIAEMQEASLKIPKGKVSIEVANADGILTKDNKIIIDTLDKYIKYLEEREMKMLQGYDRDDALNLLVQIGLAKTDVERKRLQEELEKLVQTDDDLNDKDYTITYDDDDDPCDEEEDDVTAQYKTLDELIAQANPSSQFNKVISVTDSEDSDMYDTSQIQIVEPANGVTKNEVTKPKPSKNKSKTESVTRGAERSVVVNTPVEQSVEDYKTITDTSDDVGVVGNDTVPNDKQGERSVSITINGEPLY